jgi:hypothetical protein
MQTHRVMPECNSDMMDDDASVILTRQKNARCDLHPVYLCPSKTLLASQSNARRIAPHKDPIQPIPNPYPYPSTYSSKARKTHDVIYFWKGNRTRTSKTMFLFFAALPSHKGNQCDYSSSYGHHLRAHLKMHSGEKSYKCTKCDFAWCN